MSIVKNNHNAYSTHYHIVFPVKYRKALLSPPITGAIKEIAIAIQERYDIEFEQLGCDGDHIHILCSFPPQVSGSDVVRTFKSITAKQLFKQFLNCAENSGVVNFGAMVSIWPLCPNVGTGNKLSAT
jgi:putative transposase